jgi:hypothetical protein
MSYLEYHFDCEHCRGPAVARRAGGRFCSAACRAASARARERETLADLAATIADLAVASR